MNHSGVETNTIDEGKARSREHDAKKSSRRDDTPDSPYVYVDGKKELKDGGGMIKESAPTQHKELGHVRRTS